MKKILFFSVLMLVALTAFAQMPTQSTTGIITGFIKASETFADSQVDTTSAFSLYGAIKASAWLVFTDSTNVSKIYIDRRPASTMAWAVLDSSAPGALVPGTTANDPVYNELPLVPEQPTDATLVIATHGTESWAGRIMAQYRLRVTFNSSGNAKVATPTYIIYLKYKI